MPSTTCSASSHINIATASSNMPSPCKKRVNNPYAYGQQLLKQKKQLKQFLQQQQQDDASAVHLVALEATPRAEENEHFAHNDSFNQQQQQHYHQNNCCCLNNSQQHDEDSVANSSGRNSFRGSTSSYMGGSDTESPSLSRDEAYLQPTSHFFGGNAPYVQPPEYSIAPNSAAAAAMMPPMPPLPAHLLLGVHMPQLPSGIPQRNKAVVCKRYLEGGKGACALGGLCPYRHIASAAHTEHTPRSVCKFAHCLRDNCPFFHGTEQQLRALHASGRTVYAPALVCEVRDAEADMAANNSHMPAAFMGAVPPPPPFM